MKFLLSMFLTLGLLSAMPAIADKSDKSGKGQSSEQRMESDSDEMKSKRSDSGSDSDSGSKKHKEEKQHKKEKKMKKEKEHKESGKGSEQGQSSREEHSRKWWKFGSGD